ncbi:hypothetical protein BZM27_21090 [Paraburkholderia steynii]|uniref:AAA+ ATPase domain-containing protein n=1 Tax=Paraburkholderia steynii TaxID=1245441 RepID=A0A4R0XIQ1_9BURK|nr:hypothetical protein BZM27_21090 [Paraburkholderia steynii]
MHMDELFRFDDDRDKFMQRISRIDTSIIKHGDLELAVKGLKDCVLWSRSSAEPTCAVLTGIGGAGKTTLAKAFVNAFPRVQRNYGDRTVDIVPAYYAEIPASATPKSTASSLAEGIGDPKPTRGSTNDLTKRFVKLLETCETEAIFLDEFHHLRLKGPTFGNNVCKWIKSLVDSAKTMICLVGTPDCLALLEGDEQLARRFAHRFTLGRLAAGDEKAGGALDAYLIAYFEECKIKIGILEVPDLENYVNVWRMYLATQGLPGFIRLLAKDGILVALCSGRESLAMEDLAEAFETGITSSVALTLPGVNPFRLSDARVKEAYMQSLNR